MAWLSPAAAQTQQCRSPRHIATSLLQRPSRLRHVPEPQLSQLMQLAEVSMITRRGSGGKCWEGHHKRVLEKRYGVGSRLGLRRIRVGGHRTTPSKAFNLSTELLVRVRPPGQLGLQHRDLGGHGRHLGCVKGVVSVPLGHHMHIQVLAGTGNEAAGNRALDNNDRAFRLVGEEILEG